MKDIVEASRVIPWDEFSRMTGPGRNNAALRIGSAFAQARPHDAWTSVRNLPLSDDREFLMKGVLLELAQRDPAAGLRDFMELPASSERNVMARAFFDRWAASTPALAANAVAKLPPGQTRDAALDSVLPPWVAADPSAAAQWASQLPSTRSGPPERLAVFGMGGRLNLVNVRYDRGDVMQLVAFEWARRDGHAALAWAQAETDPALRAILIRLVTEFR